jgi:hypothetical protein
MSPPAPFTNPYLVVTQYKTSAPRHLLRSFDYPSSSENFQLSQLAEGGIPSF